MPSRIALVGVLALASCATSPPPSFYSLVTTPPEAGARNLPLRVALRTVTLPRYLDRPQMVRYTTDYRLDISEYQRWGEPMGTMVSRVLIGDLAQRLPSGQVFLDSGAAAMPADAVLEVAINRFEADAGGKIALEARWVVRRGYDDKAPAAKSTNLAFPPTSPGVEGEVATLSMALGRLADEIIASLPAR